MQATRSIDFLIVGFGLAGALLAWELIQRGCRVLVVDDGELSASQVAAGLVNPVTGQRFVKSADVETLLPAAKAYYADLARVFRQPFYLEKPMLRVLRGDVEAVLCAKRLAQPAYRDYLGCLMSAVESGTDFGALSQRQTGHLLTRPLLNCLQESLRSVSAYRQARFDYGELRLAPVLQWREWRPRKVVFCEGYRVTRNPWFSWLPMRPAKGEILTLEHVLTIPGRIVNDGHWLLPIADNIVRVGATYDRERIDRECTDAARSELLAAAERLCPGLRNAAPLEQAAGVRPYAADRQPLLGRHPRESRIYLFNGFGAKGSLSIPWHCQRFADFLLDQGGVPPSSSLERHAKTHFPGASGA